MDTTIANEKKTQTSKVILSTRNEMEDKGRLMKAINFTQYGPPDVLKIKEVEKPAPGDGQVLVKIYAASVNPADYHRMEGKPFIARLMFGLRKPKDPSIGTDIAGLVEGVGPNVTQFKPGDDVFGTCAVARMGGFAEYASVLEKTLSPKPTNISYEEAAAVPLAATTALQALRKAGIKSGQKILVNGASGGVGSFAIQIAKSFGTELTGVCSTRNIDIVRSIGADHVVDYTKEDFTKLGQYYDLICDTVGNRSVFDYRRVLIPGGKCVIVGFSSMSRLVWHAIFGHLASATGNKKIGLLGVAKIKRDDLVILKELIEARKIVPVIDRRYRLAEAREAMRYAEEGQPHGKVVITMT